MGLGNRAKTCHSFAALKSVFAYRHLHAALVRKEFLLNYQQTILGPFMDLFSTLAYTHYLCVGFWKDDRYPYRQIDATGIVLFFRNYTLEFF